MLRPLAGIKVLDLTRLLPGPLCTLWLAELGAEVIKIEPPEGDHAKALSPLLYQRLNEKKKVLTLDLKGADDRLEFLDMVESTQVLVESFRPGVTKKLGIDHEALKAISPSLVYCSITGYGQSGPHADKPGHDINYLARAGILFQMQGLANFQMADIAGGALPACVGILAAIIGGKGGHIDVSMTDCVRSLNQIARARATEELGPNEDLLNGGFPFYSIYETADGRRIALGALEKKFWVNFCRAVG